MHDDTRRVLLALGRVLTDHYGEPGTQPVSGAADLWNGLLTCLQVDDPTLTSYVVDELANTNDTEGEPSPVKLP